MLRRVLFWLLWPGLFVYFRASRRVRVLLVDTEGQILLVKDRFTLWFGMQQWTLPGGGLHWLEAPKAGAIREIKEELGVDLRESGLICIGQGRTGGHRLYYQGYFFLASVSHDVSLHLKPSEIAAAKWHTHKELDMRLVGPEVFQALELLAAQT